MLFILPQGSLLLHNSLRLVHLPSIVKCRWDVTCSCSLWFHHSDWIYNSGRLGVRGWGVVWCQSNTSLETGGFFFYFIILDVEVHTVCNNCNQYFLHYINEVDRTKIIGVSCVAFQFEDNTEGVFGWFFYGWSNPPPLILILRVLRIRWQVLLLFIVLQGRDILNQNFDSIHQWVILSWYFVVL